MSLFSWLFGRNRGSDVEHRERREPNEGRKLSPAMPMAAAGAELSGTDRKGETEKNLERATGKDTRP